MSRKGRSYKNKNGLPRGIHIRHGKYCSFVVYKGVKTHLGTFITLEEAIAAREVAKLSLPVDYKNCANCNTVFEVLQKQQRFCCPSCKGSYKYTTGKVTTQSQYDRISGNWLRYLSRLVYSAGRKRENLKREELLELLEEQNYKCAISGFPLTCDLKVGSKSWSNVSVDRIKAGGPYTKDNIQLVCRAVNSWRSDMPLELFIEVCKAVANKSKESQEVKDG